MLDLRLYSDHARDAPLSAQMFRGVTEALVESFLAIVPDRKNDSNYCNNESYQVINPVFRIHERFSVSKSGTKPSPLVYIAKNRVVL